MSGIRPHLSYAGPETYEVVEAVQGGLIVEGRADGKVGLAAAGSTKVLGVAEIDAKPYTSPITTDADGFETINISPLPDRTVAGFGRYVVTYSANAAFGDPLKATANGTVAPLVVGTDNAALQIGVCDEPLGVVFATNPKGKAIISR